MTRNTRLRIAFFGMDGVLSARALEAAAAEHEVVAVIRPSPQASTLSLAGRRWLGAAARAISRRRPGSVSSAARALGISPWEARSGSDPEIVARLGVSRPDLICIAGYPWLLSAELLATAPMGGINLHAALLPRHRGVLPLFWIYFHDDRESGVTAHRVTEEADAGDVLGRDSFPLPRGFPVESLNRLNAERGGLLLRRVLAELATGATAAQPQDAALATSAPRIRPGTPMVDFASWDVERVWHFCAGLFPYFREPLTTPGGTPVRYSRVRGFLRETHIQAPGTLLRSGAGYDLYCRGGRVQVDPERLLQHVLRRP